MTGEEYEAHMTFAAADAEKVKDFDGPDWHFSQIDGDPQLGPERRCYLTAHGSDPGKLIRQMNAIKLAMLSRGVGTVRMKVEHVVYDTRLEN